MTCQKCNETEGKIKQEISCLKDLSESHDDILSTYKEDGIDYRLHSEL